MNRVAGVWLAVAGLLTTGCRSQQTQAAPGGASAALRPATLRIELTASPDIADIPRLMAVDAMRAQGYTVETLAFADTDLTVLALQRGDLDFANVSDVTGWVAIEKGAAIAAVIDDSLNPTILAAHKDLETCAALQGKRVAVPNLAGGKTFMLHRYIDRRCPGTTPAFLVVAGESARMAGLLAGEVDAAVVDLGVLQSLDSARPGEFFAQVVFAEEFPGVTALSHFARREVTKKYPAAVKDWLHALLDARRRLQDRQVLADELATRLGMAPALAAKTAVIYLERNFWDVNGRFTPAVVQQNVDFAIAAGSLKPGLKASDVADLSFLNAVLDEIGRK